MDEAQRTAFRGTNYRFDTAVGELLLKVDEPHAALRELLRSLGADCAAMITAFNPQGRQQKSSLNDAAQLQLRRDVDASGHTCLPGRNEDPANQWPVEESFLVIGIALPAARALAARYNQLAFLWMDAFTSTPRLIETAASD